MAENLVEEVNLPAADEQNFGEKELASDQPLVENDQHASEGERKSEVVCEAPAPDSFWTKMKTIFSNKCFCYLCAAGAFRFMGGYSLGFLSAKFFENRYPDYITQYSFMGAFVVIGGGLPASMVGGWLGDKYEKKIGGIKSYISGVGALCALPFILVTYAIQPPFWVAIFSYYIAYFIGEMWYGPAHAQINNMFPSEYQGFSVAVFNFSGAIAGTIMTTVLGIVTGNLNQKNQNLPEPEKDIAIGTVDGRVLACGVAISYLGCAPLFICSGKEYAKGINKLKASAIERRTLKNDININQTADTVGKSSLRAADE